MSDFGPLVTTLPEKQTAFTNKYTEIAPFLRNVPQPILSSLIREDLERINRGQNPLSSRETALGVLAAMQGQAITPEREPGLLDYFKPNTENPWIRDALLVGSTIPKIPSMMVEEFRQLPNLPEYAAQAVQTADNPLEAIGNLATAPGIRMVPLTYTASNLLGGTTRDPETGQVIEEGTPGNLLRHPLLTTLDVLPAARGALRQVPSVRNALSAQRAALEAGSLDAGRRVPLLRTALGTTSEGTPTALAQVARPYADIVRQSALGRTVGQFTGPQARTVSISRNIQQRIGEERAVPGARVLGKWIPGRDFDDPVSIWARESTELRWPEYFTESPRARFAEIPEARRLELTRMMERGEPGAIPALEGIEADFVNEYQRIKAAGDEWQLGQKNLVEVNMGGKPELLLPLEANPIIGLQNTRQRMAMLNRSWKVASGATDDVAPILTELGDVLRDDSVAKHGKLRRVEADLYALWRQGYDVGDALGAVRRAGRNKATLDEVRALVAEVRDRPPMREVPDFLAELDSIAVEGVKDKIVTDLRRAINKGDWKQVRVEIRKLKKRVGLAENEMLDRLYDEARIQREIDQYVKRVRPEFGDDAYARVGQRLARLERRTIPARFRPMLQEQLRERLKSEVDDRLASEAGGILYDEFGEEGFMGGMTVGRDTMVRRVDDVMYERGLEADELIRLIDEGNFELLPEEVFPPEDIKAIQNEIGQTWMELRDKGFDPIFVHHMRPDAANANAPIVIEQINSPTQLRKRTWDMSPYVEDAAVGLNHAALEWIGRQGSEAFFDEIVGKIGRKELDLRQELLPEARRRAGDDPRAVRAELDKIISEDWVPFDPRSFMPWKRSFPQFPRSDAWRIPRSASDTIQRMHTPPSGRMSQIFDPGMKLFRTAVLPLSPRWHIYNIIGGGIMTSARTSPWAIMKYAKQAWAMTSDANGLPVELSSGYGTLPREAVEWNRNAPIMDKVAAGFHYLGGQKLREFFDTARSYGRKGVQASYDINGKFDEFYRAIAYLEGSDKALMKGLTDEQAKRAGIDLANKIMQDWDAMTPMERQVLRYVFPFYGWMQHIMRYVFSYPLDHPIRANIVSKFARNELQDMDSGIGERFQNMFFLGQPDLDGRIRGVNLSGLNPFADFANNFTLAGFAGNAGPYLGSLLQMFGVDPVSGGPSLYPDLKYDPVAGRLVADNGNPLGIISSNFLPQSRILLNWTLNASEWKDQLRRNPDAARRAIAASLGFPTLSRDVNIHQEQIDAELDRFEAQSIARREALRTGEFGPAYQYPGLRGFLDQIRALQESGALTQYQPSNNEAVGVSPYEVIGAVNPLRAITAGPYDQQVRQLTGAIYG